MTASVRRNPILFCLLLFLCAMAGVSFPALGILCTCAVWLFRTKDASVILVFMACMMILIPRWQTQCDSMKEGKAVIVNGSYSVLQNGRKRVLVYTNEPLIYDGIYAVHGEVQSLDTVPSFFGFNSKNWFLSLGVCGSVPEKRIALKRTGHSFRSFLQKQIMKEENSKQRAQLYKILLNIRLKETDRQNWMYDNGFSYAGILAVMNMFLKYVLDRKKRRKVMAAMALILSILYRFPLLTVQAFLFSLLSFTNLDAHERTGIGLAVIILLYPHSLRSMSFLIPAVYRLTSLNRENRRIRSFMRIQMVQSFLMNTMNPVRSLGYGILQKICGFLWFSGIFSLVLPGHLFSLSVNAAAGLDSFLDQFDMPGNLLGISFPFLLAAAFFLRKKAKAPYLLCAGMLLLQITGWSHPFGELTFINVGQGDAILVRAPFNRTNVLIDTGRPSAWDKVDAMLKAKGIHHLDTLIITHGDNDHAGNRQSVITDYQPEEIVETHQKEIHAGPFVFYDLNDIINEDENESSIVNAAEFNHMQVCLMGDATENTEKKITEQYGRLHCQILKLGHHGSKTSTSDRFLDTVRPDLGIISSGAYSIYHHPSPQTIQKLLKRHIPYLDTKEEGDITILFFPHFNLLVTASGKVAIIPG